MEGKRWGAFAVFLSCGILIQPNLKCEAEIQLSQPLSASSTDVLGPKISAKNTQQRNAFHVLHAAGSSSSSIIRRFNLRIGKQ